MSDLIEVVLENIPKENVYDLLIELIGYAECISNGYSSADVDLFVDGRLIHEELVEAIGGPESLCVFFNLKNLSIGLSLLKSPLLRVVRYEGFFDIDFSFCFSDISIEFEKEMSAMASVLGVLKKKYGVAICFSGVEPAMRKDNSSLYFLI